MRDEPEEDGEEEQAPPGVAAMATLRWLLLGVTILGAGFALVRFWQTRPARDRLEQHVGSYVCPMHPAVVSDRPGQCPICGMDLVRREPASQPHAPGALRGVGSVEIGSERQQLIGVKTRHVERRALAQSFVTVGYVAADESRTSRVQTRYNGWVEQVFVEQIGQEVKKGEPLATIYSEELYAVQQEYLLALRSQVGDLGLHSAELKPVDAAHAVRRRLELLGVFPQEIHALEKAGEPIRAITLRSPVAGHVLAKSVLPGSSISPGAELFTIADLSRVWVLAEVYEQDVAGVRVGQKAALKLQALPQERFGGRVKFVSAVVGQSTRTLTVRVELENPGMVLRPGMFGEVQIDRDGTEGLVVPRDAVIDTGDQRYVFVARGGGLFEPRAVTLGVRASDFVQLLTGVAEGEEVVTGAGFLVDAESRLKAAARSPGQQ